MGQGHRIANLDRKEFVNPHALGDGYKLGEFGRNGDGSMAGLALLLAGSVRGGARGSGDFAARRGVSQVLAGRWAGDRVAIIGDYAEPGDVRGCEPAAWAGVWGDDGDWVDISEHVAAALRIERVPVRPSYSGESHESEYDAATDTFVPVARADDDEDPNADSHLTGRDLGIERALR
jgi:hypothetical protein